MKFCKDCRHFLPNPGNPKCARSRRSDEPFDPVTGEQIDVHYSCAIERTGIAPDDCGPTAKFFEPRMTVAA